MQEIVYLGQRSIWGGGDQFIMNMYTASKLPYQQTMSIGRILSEDLAIHHNSHFTNRECRAQRSKLFVMTQQVIKMSLKTGLPGSSSDLSDGLHAPPAPPPSQQAMQDCENHSISS